MGSLIEQWTEHVKDIANVPDYLSAHIILPIPPWENKTKDGEDVYES